MAIDPIDSTVYGNILLNGGIKMLVYDGKSYTLNLKHYTAITKEEALESEKNAEPFDSVGDISIFMKYIGTKDKNTMANSINFVHFYRKNKKIISYTLRCVANGIDYAVRIGAIENKSGTNIADTIFYPRTEFSYMQSKNIDTSNSFFDSIFRGMIDSPYYNLYAIDTFVLSSNNGAESHAVMNEIHSIHLMYIEKRLYSYAIDVLKPKKYLFTKDRPLPLIRADIPAIKDRTKEMKSFCIRLRNPIYLRRSNFKGICYRE